MSLIRPVREGLVACEAVRAIKFRLSLAFLNMSALLLAIALETSFPARSLNRVSAAAGTERFELFPFLPVQKGLSFVLRDRELGHGVTKLTPKADLDPVAPGARIAR